MCLCRGFWGWFATCGSTKGRRSLLGNFASLILSWTVASAVFDALDIVATFCYEEPSRPAIVSAIFSFFSIWYGLVQRRHDFDELSKMGAKRRKPFIHLGNLAQTVGIKKLAESVGGKMKGLRERTTTLRGLRSDESEIELIGGKTTISPVVAQAAPLVTSDTFGSAAAHQGDTVDL